WISSSPSISGSARSTISASCTPSRAIFSAWLPCDEESTLNPDSVSARVRKSRIVLSSSTTRSRMCLAFYFFLLTGWTHNRALRISATTKSPRQTKSFWFHAQADSHCAEGSLSSRTHELPQPTTINCIDSLDLSADYSGVESSKLAHTLQSLHPALT